MEQAVEILLSYSPQSNVASAPSFPVERFPPQTVNSGGLTSRIEQIDLTIASLTSQKIDCVQREQYAAAQRHVLETIRTGF